MKTETVTIQVQRYTDDNGAPLCGKCVFWEKCTHRGYDLDGNYFPENSCPIWNNDVKPKWATFDDWFLHEYKGCLKKELLIGVWEAAREDE